MSKIAIFLANGLEEVEGLMTVDIIRRAGIDIDMISISDDIFVTGSHNICIKADTTFSEVEDFTIYDCIILPGGIPGTPNLNAHSELKKLIGQFNQDNKLLTAICAAPTIYGEMGLLKGKKATCYPGLEDKLLEANFIKDKVAIDGNFITSRGLGTAIDFALAIVERFKGKDAADEIAQKIVYR